MQVRNTQLNKEARELRAENMSMQETLEHVKHEAVSGEKARHHYQLWCRHFQKRSPPCLPHPALWLLRWCPANRALQVLTETMGNFATPCPSRPVGLPSLTQVVAAEARAKELQEELTGTYKEKSRLAEELVAASRQLQIVRDSNEAQARPKSRPPAANSMPRSTMPPRPSTSSSLVYASQLHC